MSESEQSSLYFKRSLESVVDFLRSNGVPPNEIRQIVEDRLGLPAVVSGPAPSVRKARASNDIDTVYAEVLHRWHREPKLLDESANPRGIRLFGKSPSVESLVRSEHPDASPRKIAASMRKAGLVLRRGRGQYFPASRIATVSMLSPMIIEHVSKSLARFLDTVLANTSSSRNLPTLIERYTHIPDLPRSELAKFREFSQSHGTSFLAEVDDWLEARRVKRKPNRSKRGLAAGIHVFAYVEQEKRQR